MTRLRALLVGLVALALSACASVQRMDAAGDVHALLISIRDNDQATFDAHVDRAALKGDLQVKLNKRIGKDERLRGIASLLGPSLIDFAGDTLIQPKVFRLVAEHYGYSQKTRIPSQIEIAQVLKELPDGRICAVTKKNGPCTLVFTKEGDVWRLTSFEGDMSMLRIQL